jgi:glycosyltransferase involved in cell wall biosynthesis
VGGAELLAARLARQLGNSYRFVFVCLDELGMVGRELRGDGFPVFVLSRRPGVDWNTARRLAGLLRRQRVDLLHAHQYTPFFYTATARLLYRRPPILFTEHGRWYPDYPRRKRIVLNRLVLQRRDRVVGVGESVRQALIDNEGISADRVSVIYNGIDVARYQQNGSDTRWSIRRELGLRPDDVVVVQVARLDYLKDHLTAVRTMARVTACRGDVRLILVGDGPEQATIQQEICRCGLGEHVRLLGLRTDVARLLAASDVFLLTSISEGIPLTVIEAMAAGLPVVSTRVGGVAEIVEEGRTGLLAPARDDGALAEALLLLAADPALRATMGQLGRERAAAVFSEARMHDGYRQLYENMLGG